MENELRIMRFNQIKWSKDLKVRNVCDFSSDMIWAPFLSRVIMSAAGNGSCKWPIEPLIMSRSDSCLIVPGRRFCKLDPCEWDEEHNYTHRPCTECGGGGSSHSLAGWFHHTIGAGGNASMYPAQWNIHCSHTWRYCKVSALYGLLKSRTLPISLTPIASEQLLLNTL